MKCPNCGAQIEFDIDLRCKWNLGIVGSDGPFLINLQLSELNLLDATTE